MPLPSPSFSSVDVSLLSFSLSTWLEGSAELRRALVHFPRGLSGRFVRRDVEDDDVFLGSHRAAQFVNRYIPWFTSPKRDLDDTEKFFMSTLDVSTAFVLLRLLGSTQFVPLLFDPLSAILPLRNKLATSSVRWSRVVATTLLLTVFHETERVTVSTFVSWLRSKKRGSLSDDFKNVIIRGDERTPRTEDEDDDDEVDSCIICAGEGTEPTPTLSDSISSLSAIPSHSSSSNSLGPLEQFCIHAPQKHLMHRACFLAWKDACWEDRTRPPAPPPVVALACDDASIVPVPGTQQWIRALAILRAGSMFASAPMQHIAFAPVGPDDLVGLTLGSIPVGQSMLTLHTKSDAGDGEGRSSRTATVSEVGPLATMVSKWPSCPACRSVVKMTFATVPPLRKGIPTSFRGSLVEKYPPLRWAFKWVQIWNELVTGRTIFAKSLSQMAFVLILVYAMRIKRSSDGRGFLFTRSLLPFTNIVSL